MLGLHKMRNREAGDTLIEVLFAMTVFASIVVTSLSLMNQGVAAAQRSFEITTVRQQMDGQATALRFLHDSYVEGYQKGQVFNLTDATTSPAEEYYKVIQFVILADLSEATPFAGSATCPAASDLSKNFVINPVTAQLVTTTTNPVVFKKASTFSQLVYGSSNQINFSEGMWVEGVRPDFTTTATGYIDFHIRSCWDAPGLDVPMTLGTIVRLYEPRS